MKPNDFDNAVKDMKLPKDLEAAVRACLVEGMSQGLARSKTDIDRLTMVSTIERVLVAARPDLAKAPQE